MEASQNKSKTVLFIVILGLLMGLVFLAGKNQSLSKKYNDLVKSSKKLEASVAELQTKNEKLSAEMQKFNSSAGDIDQLRSQYQEEIERIKKENENLQYEMKKSEEAMKSAVDEKSYLEDMLINKTKEIESLKKQNPSSPSPAVAASTISGSVASSQISADIAKKDEEIKKLTDQNKILAEKLDRLYQITTAKITEINVAKIALEETLSNAKQTIDQEWGTVNLGTISVAPASAPASKPETRTGPKQEGKILAVNEAHGFVVVDMGKIDNVPAGASFLVMRDGKNIATLSVLEVRDVMTACNIKFLTEGEKIQINDLVLIQK